MATEEITPYIKEHNGTHICFADTITQATNALTRANIPTADQRSLENGHLMLFGVEKFENMVGFQKAFSSNTNTFTRLEIFGCEMNDKAQMELAEAFDPKFMGNIKTLDLDNTSLDPKGAHAIFTKVAECQNIEKLNLQGSVEKENVLKSIADALVENCNLFNSLSDLDLKINDLKPVAAESVAALMTRFNSAANVVKVDLFYNDIGPRGAEHIGAALSNDRCLVTHLDLCCNNIGDDGATAIARALVFNNTLVSLKLALNNIGNVGAIAILKSIYPIGKKEREANGQNTKLALLDLSANIMKENIAENVAKPTRDPVKYEEIVAELNKINFQLDEIEMDLEGDRKAEQKELEVRLRTLGEMKRQLVIDPSPLCTQILEVLQKSRSITDIDLTGIELDGRGWDMFSTGLLVVPDNKTVRFSIVDLMSEENLKTVESKIWGDAKDKFKHIDWRRRDDAPAVAGN